MHLSEQDKALVEEARCIIRDRQKEKWHQVGSALRTRSGRVFSAVNVGANVGRVAVCAEAIALGMACAAGDSDIDTVVAVNRNGEIVSPCGMCRELISDYAPQARVIIAEDPASRIVPVGDLLPDKYR
jgi:cytidine deaminase